MVSMRAMTRYLCCPNCKKEIVLTENEAFFVALVITIIR